MLSLSALLLGWRDHGRGRSPHAAEEVHTQREEREGDRLFRYQRAEMGERGLHHGQSPSHRVH